MSQALSPLPVYDKMDEDPSHIPDHTQHPIPYSKDKTLADSVSNNECPVSVQAEPLLQDHCFYKKYETFL